MSTQSNLPFAPDGTLTDYQRESFSNEGKSLDVYRKGTGPAVLILTEIPGITPQVIGFADLVAARGFTVVLPDLFGQAGKAYASLSLPGRNLYTLQTLTQLCVSREFTVFATGRSSPIVSRLRALAAHEHARCGGPGVGVIGMCFTGGFALAMAVDPRVLVPVLVQPSLPAPFTRQQRHNIDTDRESLRAVARRCEAEGLEVLGMRFRGDPLVPGARFQFLQEQLGDGFVKIELKQSEGHPRGPIAHRHSVLTGDLIDQPEQPTYEARERVFELLRRKLLAS